MNYEDLSPRIYRLSNTGGMNNMRGLTGADVLALRYNRQPMRNRFMNGPQMPQDDAGMLGNGGMPGGRGNGGMLGGRGNGYEGPSMRELGIGFDRGDITGLLAKSVGQQQRMQQQRMQQQAPPPPPPQQGLSSIGERQKKWFEQNKASSPNNWADIDYDQFFNQKTNNQRGFLGGGY